MSDAIGAAATPLSRALRSPFFAEFFFKQEELDPHYGDVLARARPSEGAMCFLTAKRERYRLRDIVEC